MTISTSISGYWRRFDGDNQELNRRLSESVTVTEYGGNKIAIAPGSKNISIRPQGLAKIQTLYIETDGELNVEMTGAKTASINLLANGILCLLRASLSNVRLSNRNATSTRNVFYDLAG